MRRTFRLGAILCLGGAFSPPATAQAPPGANGPAVRAQGGATQQPAGAAQPQRPRRRSIVHHYPYPYPEYYHGDQSAGFRNPGGIGRNLEYYPAGNQFQENNDPVRVAQFDTGFGNRTEQMQAQQVGIQRQNSIMNHIDNYARPSFGVGFFGGFY